MDREKVIKGIEHCLKESEHIHDNPCRGCPYEDIDSGVGSRCVDVLMSDALTLLKEQEVQIYELQKELNCWQRKGR